MDSNNNQLVYSPGEDSGWQILDTNENLLKEDDPHIENKGIAGMFDICGICDHSNLNKNFQELISELEITDKTTEELIKLLTDTVKPQKQPFPLDFEDEKRKNTQNERSLQSFIQIVGDVYFRRISIEKAARIGEVDLPEARKMLSYFTKQLKVIKINNKRYLNKHKKLVGAKLAWIKEYLEKSKFNIFKIDDLRLYLRNREGGSCSISNSTLGRTLRKEFGMTYKKINKIHPIACSIQNKRKMLEAASIQIELFQKEVLVIYLDEFKFSCHSNKHYGWTRKGESGHFKLTPCSFQASFMIAFSHKKIHGVMATNKTFNSIKFIYFLRQMIQKLEESYAIICDNSKIHVSKAVSEFLVNQQLCLITIPPYSPFVNSCEKLILLIKSRMRREEREGRNISLRTFKNCMNEIKQDELNGCIKASLKETLDLVL